MSKKNLILKELRCAKRGHIAWVQRAELLIKGYPVTEEQAPLSHAECPFGTWYLESSAALQQIPAFKAIDGPHQELHDAYRTIFQALFEGNNISIFKRLIGHGAAVERRQKRTINENQQKLEQASKQVLLRLEEFENQILAMSDDELVQLFT